jgi:hypothetical protein
MCYKEARREKEGSGRKPRAHAGNRAEPAEQNTAEAEEAAREHKPTRTERSHNHPWQNTERARPPKATSAGTRVVHAINKTLCTEVKFLAPDPEQTNIQSIHRTKIEILLTQ